MDDSPVSRSVSSAPSSPDMWSRWMQKRSEGGLPAWGPNQLGADPILAATTIPSIFSLTLRDTPYLRSKGPSSSGVYIKVQEAVSQGRTTPHVPPSHHHLSVPEVDVNSKSLYPSPPGSYL
ncbi:hypothetical protein GWK47_047198 [Chionoecetes opilio]|uniref:Uncharacterized protein n=1 Tax=Chionoecetes opilio TaxID=41210 RepID=A0A8J4Y5I0_CHIOP|nr:hypothetical protein GWK47_047198 [Chionoecetes opilio]